MSQYVAFYGTLKSKHTTPIANLIKKHMELVGTCIIPGLIYKMPRYPAFKPGNGHVVGELYHVNDTEIFASFDRYEATDNEDPSLPGFSRQLIKLIEPKLSAWVYCYDGPVDNAELILSGEWN